MPLHEYLEQKRRQNIAALNASRACHICGSTCRNSRGFHHFLDDGNDGGGDEKRVASFSVAEVGGGYSHECSLVPRPNLAAMRTCACFGQDPSDPDYWPYSLRVCDKCIEDDAGIGRIRSCGICGTVACDENCGAELLECTDRAEWNNAGCLECRRMGDFSEMDIFRKSMAKRELGKPGGEPRITRICAKCLDVSTPWVKYDFVCRRFRCETRLVPSDIAERKRFCTFGSSPLNLLPGDSLVAVVDFLTGSDLKQLFLTCSAMCTVAERVAKEKVERVHSQYPTGPIVVAKRKDGFGQLKNWTHFEGKNDFGLRAPDDEKAWVGVYHFLEKITKEMFYFGFQTTGTDADGEAVERFINRRGCHDVDKFAFGQVYSKSGTDLVPSPTSGVSVRGGCLLVTGENVSPVPLTVASSDVLRTGTHRVLLRLFCPGSGGARGGRDASSYRLGSVGILRTNQRNITGEGPLNAWAHRSDVAEGWLKEDVVVGIEYNVEERSLVIHSNSHVSRASRFASNRHAIAEVPGDLRIAVELASKAVSVAQTLLTVREVDADEWTRFIDHTAEGAATLGPAERAAAAATDMAADVFDHMDAAEAMEAAIADGGDALLADPAAAADVWRLAARNRRRERERPAAGGIEDEGALRGLRARHAADGGRGVVRAPLPRREQDANVVDLIDAAAAPVRAVARTRRVLRALRPFARAAAVAEEMQVDGEEMAFRLHENDTGLVDMDEEVAAGEFVQQIEILADPMPEPDAARREGNSLNIA